MFRIAIFLIGLACFSCGKMPEKETHRKKILSTTSQIGDIVAEVGGERVVGQVLVRGELNPHTYELVKGDDEKIAGAACVFYNGLGLEHGASVAAMLAEHPNAVAVSRFIPKEKILWKDKVPDPHIWMDVSLWKEIVDPIVDQLSRIDPEGKEYYHSRGIALKEKMELLDLEMKTVLHKIDPEKRYLVTSHDAFHYFTRRYLAEENEANWEERFAAPEGLSPDGQLNTLDLKKIIDHLEAHDIRVIFPESNVSRDSIRKIATAGKKVKICNKPLYGDSLRGNYLDAMKQNAEVIADEISGN